MVFDQQLPPSLCSPPVARGGKNLHSLKTGRAGKGSGGGAFHTSKGIPYAISFELLWLTAVTNTAVFALYRLCIYVHVYIYVCAYVCYACACYACAYSWCMYACIAYVCLRQWSKEWKLAMSHSLNTVWLLPVPKQLHQLNLHICQLRM